MAMVPKDAKGADSELRGVKNHDQPHCQSHQMPPKSSKFKQHEAIRWCANAVASQHLRLVPQKRK